MLKKFSKSNSVNYSGTKYLVDNIIKSKKIWFFLHHHHMYIELVIKIKKSDIQPLTLYGKTKLKSEKYLFKKLKK